MARFFRGGCGLGAGGDAGGARLGGAPAASAAAPPSRHAAAQKSSAVLATGLTLRWAPHTPIAAIVAG